MAYVSSKDIVLEVDMGTEAAPDWKRIACSTSDGFSLSSDAQAIATKCSGDFVENLPGDISWSFSNSIYVPKDPQASFLTEAEVFDLSVNRFNSEGNLYTFRLISNDPDFDFLRQGKGFISDLSLSTDAGDYLQQEITITGSGEVINTVTP